MEQSYYLLYTKTLYREGCNTPPCIARIILLIFTDLLHNAIVSIVILTDRTLKMR